MAGGTGYPAFTSTLAKTRHLNANISVTVQLPCTEEGSCTTAETFAEEFG